MSTPIDPSTHTIGFVNSGSVGYSMNMVRDGCFTNKDLLDWENLDGGSGVSERDEQVRYRGFPTLRLKITDTDDQAEVQQKIAPDDHDETDYEFSCVIKTQNLGADDNDKWMSVDIFYTDGTVDLGSANADQRVTPSYDNQGFEVLSGSFSSNGAKKIDFIRVRIRLSNISNQSGVGYLWVTMVNVTSGSDYKEEETFNLNNDGDVAILPKYKIEGRTSHVTDVMIPYADSDAFFVIDSTNDYIAQEFSPKYHKISKIGVCMEKVGSLDEYVYVEIVPLDSSGDPDESNVIAKARMYANLVSAVDVYWYEFDVLYNNLDPSKHYAIIIRSDSTLLDGSNYIRVRYHTGDVWPIFSDDAHCGYFESTNGGTSWTEQVSRDVCVYTKVPYRFNAPRLFRSYAFSYEANTVYTIGTQTTYSKACQTFLCDFNHRLHSVLIKPGASYDSPTGDLIVSIQKTVWNDTDSWWEPSGVIVCQKTIPKDLWDDVSATPFAEHNLLVVTFDYCPILTKGEQYAIVVEKTGEPHASGYYTVLGSDTSLHTPRYDDGKALHWHYSNEEWTEVHANYDMSFSLLYVPDDTPFRLLNTSTGKFLDLEGELLDNAEIHIYKNGRGRYIHEYYKNTNWEQSHTEIEVGDVRWLLSTGDYDHPSNTVTYIEGTGCLIWKYDFLFPVLPNPVLQHRINDGTYEIYYSYDGYEWILLESGTGANPAVTVELGIPVRGTRTLYIRFEGLTEVKILDWMFYADLDCSEAIGKMTLSAIGNNAIQVCQANKNMRQVLDFEFLKIDGLTKGSMVGTDGEMGYEMSCMAIPIATPFTHGYVEPFKGYGVKQTSKYQTLKNLLFDFRDISSNFADLHKVMEFHLDQRLVFIHTPHDIFQGLISDVQNKVIGGITTRRQFIIDLDETRQIE